MQVQVWLENIAIAIAGLALFFMGGLIVTSILGKHLMLKPIPDDLLMVGLLNIAVIVLPLACVERSRGHITVTVTTDWMGAKSLNILNAFGAMCMAVFFGGIGTMVAKRMPDEIAKGAYYDGVLQIPTWPMKFIFGIGILLLVLRLIFTIIENISEFFDKNEIHCKE